MRVFFFALRTGPMLDCLLTLDEPPLPLRFIVSLAGVSAAADVFDRLDDETEPSRRRTADGRLVGPDDDRLPADEASESLPSSARTCGGPTCGADVPSRQDVSSADSSRIESEWLPAGAGGVAGWRGTMDDPPAAAHDVLASVEKSE
jgi:hypothetical protein